MHFWIDKRSSNLHNYGGGRGRMPGAGGFYSRTFGTTRHHPPPLIRQSSSSSSSSSPQQAYPQPLNQQPNHQSSNYSHGQPHCHNQPHQPQGFRSNGTGTTINNNNLPPLNNHQSSNSLSQNSFQIPFTRIRYQDAHHQTPSPASVQTFAYPIVQVDPNVTTSGVIPPQMMCRMQGAGHPQQNNEAGILRNYFQGGSIGGGFSGGPPPGRRPRSQSHNAANRRRSSGGSNSNVPNQRRSSLNRWTYEPYNLQQARSPHQNQTQGWSESRGEPTPPSPLHTGPISLSDLQSQRNGVAIPAELVSSLRESGQSCGDPAWKRTKRIGLTLCFMAFILLSTVATRFFIEAPWLIDRRPTGERTEATIYFFLTELIFVVFAIGLFFTGVTCLRKRTNAYLLRQFNNYLMHPPQTTPEGELEAAPPEYFLGNGGVGINSSNMLIGGGLNASLSDPDASPRLNSSHSAYYDPNSNLPFAYHRERQALLARGVCAKPPPYHIALYLPIPENSSNMTSTSNTSGSTTGVAHKDSLDKHEQGLSSWISSSSCQTEAGADKTESEGETEEGVPRRKRQRKGKDEADRAETPPPPYGQL